MSFDIVKSALDVSFQLFAAREAGMARAGSHPGRQRGPLSGVDLPPERWPHSAARDPDRA
jgi:hypothetical protein